MSSQSRSSKNESTINKMKTRMVTSNFYKTGKLSEIEKNQIKDVIKDLLRGGVTLDEVFEKVKDALRERNEAIEGPELLSKAKAMEEIKEMLSALEKLSFSSTRILDIASKGTPIPAELVKRGIKHRIFRQYLDYKFFIRCMFKGRSYEKSCSHLGVFCIDTLKIACEIALDEESQCSCFHTPDGVCEIYTKKANRPIERENRELCCRLADIFEAVTDREAAISRDGPFERFVFACMQIVDPKDDYLDISYYKLIRTTLRGYRKKKNHLEKQKLRKADRFSGA